MDSEIITLAGALSFFSEDLGVIGKAELKIKSNHVISIKIEDFQINAKIRASWKDTAYHVIVNVDGTGGINSAMCECPRGKWICSHMATVAIYVNKNGMSKTDLPNSWIPHPRRANKENIQPMKELFPSSKNSYSALPRKSDMEDRKYFQMNLFEVDSTCPMKWIAGPEPPPPSHLSSSAGIMESISDLFPLFQADRNEFLSKCRVDPDQIATVAEETKLQSKSQLWGRMRSYRLTESNCGRVIKAFDRHSWSGAYPESLFKTLCGEYNLSCKSAIMWGQMHEDAAIKAYQDVTGNTVEKAGLFLFPCGYLGCTPDGIIFTSDGKRAVLEIKCPWTHRNKTFNEIMTEKQEKDTSSYLDKCGLLKKSHEYWHQMQGEMAAIKTLWGHFVLWTTKDIQIITVMKDNDWGETNLPKLTDFYLNTFLPHVTYSK